MRKLSKSEKISIVLILAIIAVVTYKNLLVALRRARDTRRNDDLVVVTDALNRYFEEYGFYPPSDNGMIKACKDSDFDQVIETLRNRDFPDNNLLFEGLKGCVWGEDPLPDVLGDSGNYLRLLPRDPKTDQGIQYLYLSNTRRYQIFGYLEGEGEEVRYDSRIVDRQLNCGSKLCSFGRSSDEIPLHLSIQEYEQMLLQEKDGSQN